MTSLDRALHALQRGNPMTGERLVMDAIRVAERAYGVASLQACQAQYEASQYFHAAGKPPEMIDALIKATRFQPGNAQEQAARFGYLFQLGAALDRQGDIEEAEGVLRSLLFELNQAYGPSSVASATGSVALSGVLFEQGEIDEALGVLEEAIQTLDEHQDSGIAAALALRAFVVKAYSPVEPCFPEGIDLEDEEVELLVQAALERVKQSAPQLALIALGEIDELVCETLGEEHPTRRRLLTQMVHTAGESGQAEAQLAALGTLDELAAQAGELPARSDIALAKAESYIAAGNSKQALAEFGRAAEFAGNNYPVLTVALARHAQYLAALGEQAQAEATMQAAEDAARDAKDPELLGSCLVTFGVMIVRRDEEAAQVKFESALDLLPLGHPDGDVAAQHLQAIESGGLAELYGETELFRRLRELLDESFPKALLKGVVQDESGFRVDLAREPSEQERLLLESALQQLAQPA